MQYDEPREHIILGNEANPPRAGLHRERNGLAAPRGEYGIRPAQLL